MFFGVIAATQKKLPLSTIALITRFMSYDFFISVGTIFRQFRDLSVDGVRGGYRGWTLLVVLRKEAQQALDRVEAGLIILGGEVDHAGPRAVYLGPAQVLE